MKIENEAELKAVVRLRVILTGTSGAGKSTLSKLLWTTSGDLAQVPAVTTRQPRSDDAEGDYEHLSESAFDTLETTNSLLIRAQYRQFRYGITYAHLNEVESRRMLPMMLITPNSLKELINSLAQRAHVRSEPNHVFYSIFLDAPDNDLDERLLTRNNTPVDASILQQRKSDRECRKCCSAVVENIDLQDTLRELQKRIAEQRKLLATQIT